MTLYDHRGSSTERDDFLRALGRFVVRFSWFIHLGVESPTAGILQWTDREDVLDTFNATTGKSLRFRSDGDDPGRSGLYRQVMGVLSRLNSTERELKVYFALCETFGRLVWKNEDRRLVEAVKTEALAINGKRNRLMHDSWAVFGENATEISDQPVPSNVALRMRTRASQNEVEEVTAKLLDADSDYLERLTDVVGVIRMVQFQVELLSGGQPTQPYSSLFQFGSDGRVVRREQ
jgi:hypothetical protein